MQARSALFELYGDHLRQRGGRAPIAALVSLLAPLGIAAPAVRTAVSRMVRQGWLHPMRLVSGPGYVLTPRAARRLDETTARTHRSGRTGWDGRFDLVLLHGRMARGPAARLRLLGYGALGEHAWVAPRPSHDVDATLREAGVGYDRFSAGPTAGSPGAADLVARAWDLDGIGRAYERFVAEHRPLVAAVNGRSTDEDAYATRFALMHAWRSLGLRDPHLPAALLPPRWPGAGAAAFVDRHAARLWPAADRHVEHCLATAGPRRG